MLFHYLKVAYRILIKNNIYSLISVFGLSIALSLAFIIFGFILYQFSFNKYHKNYKRVYRAISINKEGNNKKNASSPFILARALKSNFPEVKEAARLVNLPFNIGDAKIKKDDEYIKESEFYSADQEIFSILDIPIKSKSVDLVLADPYNIVLSESMAYKYFDQDNPLGKTLSLRIFGKSFELKITGIMFDFPENSSIKADFFCSTSLYIELISPYYHDQEEITKSWEEQIFVTFILLNKKVDADKFELKLNNASAYPFLYQ